MLALFTSRSAWAPRPPSLFEVPSQGTSPGPVVVAFLKRQQPMKAMTKSQLAKAAGVSRWTLSRWLKEPYMLEQMAKYPLSKKYKLPGQLVKIICEHYVIDIA